jgi:hypothetical protein
MSTELTITGPTFQQWEKHLKLSGFILRPLNTNQETLGQYELDARVFSPTGYGVGSIQRVPHQDFGRVSLHISTGWCSFGLIQEVLERIECKHGL